MVTTHSVQAVIGVTGLKATSGGVTISRERIARLELPQSFTKEHIGRLQKDLEILSEIANQHPEEMIALQNAVLKHDFQTAVQKANEIGLNEEEIIAKDGGVWILVIGIAIAAAVLLAHD